MTSMIFADGRIYGESSMQTYTLSDGEIGHHIDVTVICDSGRHNAKRSTHIVRLIGQQAQYVAREAVIGQHVTFVGHESNYFRACSNCDHELQNKRIESSDLVNFTLNPIDFDNPQGPVDIDNYDGKHHFRWLDNED